MKKESDSRRLAELLEQAPISNALTRIRDLLGEVSNLRVVADRRGSLLLRAQTGREELAIKIGVDRPEAATLGPSPRTLVQREANVLRRIPYLVDSYFRTSGDCTNGAFLVTQWLDGRAVHKVLREARSSPTADFDRTFRAVALLLFRCVGQLHAAGWRHCDLQPDHFLLDLSADKCRLIDFALAQGELVEPEITFKGGLVHFNSPETCRAILSGSPSVNVSEVSEVYSTAAVITFLRRSQIPVDYGSNDPNAVSWEAMLEAIGNGKLHPLEELGFESESQLTRVLRLCMRREPTERPQSISIVLEMLSHE